MMGFRVDVGNFQVITKHVEDRLARRVKEVGGVELSSRRARPFGEGQFAMTSVSGCSTGKSGGGGGLAMVVNNTY